ncbi:MAG: virulence protein [Enterocloster citroniae]|nr:virulence protein [Enterocloster citroniae]
MRIEFNRTGTERKALVQAMGEILGAKPKYLGMPTAAYQVGCFRIDKNGAVESDGPADSREAENLLERLAERGIAAAQAETAQEEGADSMETQESATDALGETAPAEQQEAGIGLTVSLPRESFTDAALENLQKLVDAKAALIRKALAVDSLPVEADEEKVSFPWFADGQDGDSAKAYTHFITALCDMARKQKRVTAKEKPADNEKYAFRCFLLRLGFIGAEYKEERKILLKNLSGNGSFKSGAGKGAADDGVSE